MNRAVARGGAFRTHAWLLWLCASLLPGAAAAAPLVALDGTWQALGPGQPGTAQARPFDPRLGLTLPRSPDAHEVLLFPRGGHWPDGPWMLELRQAALLQVTLDWPPQQPQTRSQADAAPGQWPAHGRLGFRVEHPPADGAPLRLRVESHGARPATLLWEVRAEHDYLRRDVRWLTAATASFAMMLTTALMAAFFAWRLRDATYAFYALYVLAFTVVMAAQTGYAVHPLGLHWLGTDARFWGRLATAATVVLAIVFLDRFADLPRHLPRARRWLHGYAAAVALCALMALLPLASLEAVGVALINPLLTLGAPLLLVVATHAGYRGSRMALVFVIGWTPLLVVTALSSLALLARADVAWDPGLYTLAAGAFEALVLSLGLAERSSVLRIERDLALQQARTDALTGLFNRRSWDQRLLALLAKATAERPLAVMFLDLDHFKQVNDVLGHAAGDRCLQTFARAMVDELDPDCPAGRYGGEEFVVALPGAGAEGALRVAERIRARFRTVAGTFGALHPTVSIGVAVHRPGESPDELVRRADRALYEAKQGGRDRVCLADC